MMTNARRPQRPGTAALQPGAAVLRVRGGSVRRRPGPLDAEPSPAAGAAAPEPPAGSGRSRLDRPAAAASAGARRTVAETSEMTASEMMAARTASLREHLAALAAAAPRLPGEFRSAADRLLAELQGRRLVGRAHPRPRVHRLGRRNRMGVQEGHRPAAAAGRCPADGDRVRADARHRPASRLRPLRSGDLRAREHRRLPGLRLAAALEAGRPRLSGRGRDPAPGPRPGSVPPGAGRWRAAGSRALPRHPVVRRRRPVLVSPPGALRRVVRLRAGHARCPQRPGLLAGGTRARGLCPRARAACHRAECRLGPASRIGRPSGRDAAPRPSRGRALASVPLPGAALGALGRGPHAPVLALGGRAPPARGDHGRPAGEPPCLAPVGGSEAPSAPG